MYLTIIAFLYRLSQALARASAHCASALRRVLGPEPQNYWLLGDGRVISSHIVLPTEVMNSAFFYESSSARITAAHAPSPAGRFRPLTYVGIQIHDAIVGSTDISDWLGEVRANPVPILTPHQIVTLWSHVHNQYAPPFRRGTTIRATNSMGEETMLNFE
jgi:hypothetical protein